MADAPPPIIPRRRVAEASPEGPPAEATPVGPPPTVPSKPAGNKVVESIQAEGSSRRRPSSTLSEPDYTFGADGHEGEWRGGVVNLEEESVAEPEVERFFFDAARKGNAPLLIDMIEDPECPVDINFVDVSGETALHYCAQYDHAGAAAALIQLGADPDARNPTTGNTPLHYAGFKSHIEVVICLLDHGADKEAMNYDGAKPVDMCKKVRTETMLQPEWVW